MAGCNHRCKFRWTDVRHPGVTWDYREFSALELKYKFEQEENNILLQGHSLIGDQSPIIVHHILMNFTILSFATVHYN